MFGLGKVAIREPQPRAPIEDRHICWRTAKPVEGAIHRIMHMQDVLKNPGSYEDLKHGFRFHPLPDQDAGDFNSLIDLALELASGSFKAGDLIFCVPEKTIGSIYPPMQDTGGVGFMLAETVEYNGQMHGLEGFFAKRCIPYPGQTRKAFDKMLARLRKVHDEWRGRTQVNQSSRSGAGMIANPYAPKIEAYAT